MGGSRIITEWHAASMYSRQKDPVFDGDPAARPHAFRTSRCCSRGRTVFAPVVKPLKSGMPFYYLPDMDLGGRDSVFVPFFGVPAATITGLSRIAQLAGAVIVPCVTRQLPEARVISLRFYPAWDDFPSGDLEADARRMNAFIEERVREMPEQYYWLHKRFKTRPAGEPNPYSEAARVNGDASGARILPLQAADVDELIALAGEIWRRHYADIISAAQIEYMLDAAL